MLRQLAIDYPWFVASLLVLFLFALAIVLIKALLTTLGTDIDRLVQLLRQEQTDYRGGKNTMGAINWRAMRYVAIIGLVCIIGFEFESVIHLLVSALGTERISTFKESVTLFNYFTMIILVIIVSLLAVYGVERSKYK
jgi:hypothetical protein